MPYPVDRINNGQEDNPSPSSPNMSNEHEEQRSAQSPKRPISYWTLLADPQIAVLCFLRIAGQLATLSLLSYLPFQLKYLSPNASDDDLAVHAGLLMGAKTLAKVLTGVPWGLASDAYGRKTVLLIGLIGSAVSNAGYGFSTTFSSALIWQFVQGAATSEMALTRTIAAELYATAPPSDRSRAILLPLLVSGIGMILGPILGGFASHPTGLGILSRYPYSLPNVIVALWYAASALLVYWILHETLQKGYEHAKETSASIAERLRSLLGWLVGRSRSHTYQEVRQEESIQMTTHHLDDETDAPPPGLPASSKSAFRQIWTTEVISVMTAHFIITGHISTFGTVYTIFLSTPITPTIPATNPDNGARLVQRSFLSFSIQGGLGLTAPQLGTFFTCATILFALLQGLVFPRVVRRVGTVRLWRTVLLIFPGIYFFAPFPNLLTSESHLTPLAWIAISFIMVIYMAAQALVMPPMVILISESVPHNGVRGLVNAVGTTVPNLARSVFPVLVMSVYGLGVKHGFLAGAFWLLSGMAVIAIIASRWIAPGLDPDATLKRTGDSID